MLRQVLYATGAFSFMLSRGSISAHAQFIYTDKYGLSPDLVSVAWSVFALLAAFSEPLIGYASSRYGTRTKWIYWAILPMIISHYLIWVPPKMVLSGSSALLLVYFTSVLSINGLAEAIIGMNYGSFLGMMFDGAERVSAASLKNSFAILGMLIALPLPTLIGGDGWANIELVGITMSSLLLSFTLCVPVLQEKKDPNQSSDGLYGQMAGTLKHKNFAVFMFSNVSAQVSLSLTLTVMSLTTKYIVQLTNDYHGFNLTLGPAQQVAILTTLMYLTSIFTNGIWASMARKIGNRTTWQWGIVAFGLGLIGAGMFARGFPSALVLFIVLGFTVSPHMLVRELLLLEIVEEHAQQSGKRMDLVFVGVNGLLLRVSSMIQGVVLGAVLSYVGYGDASVDSSSIERAVYSLFCVIPCVFLALAWFGVRKLNVKLNAA